MRKIMKFMLGLTVMSMVISTVIPGGNPRVQFSQTAVYGNELEVLQGRCGDNATYKYDDETKTITISGTGAMWENYEFAEKMRETETIIIEEGITTVGECSFLSLLNVKKVSLPESLTTIKEGAFNWVNGEVEIPKNVVDVETQAFYGATKFIIRGDLIGYKNTALGVFNEIVLCSEAKDLGKVLLGIEDANVTIAIENNKCSIVKGCLLSSDGKELYYALKPKKKTVIPDTVETISAYAFYASGIKALKLGKNVANIEEGAFLYTNIKKVTINDKLKTIGELAFCGTKIKSVNFKKKVKIGEKAFDENVKFKYAKFKASQTCIDIAEVGKKKYNIKFAKVSDANGYQIKVKNDKKTYKYTTNKNSYTGNAPKTLAEDYEVEELEEFDSSEVAYVWVRPYKIVKNKKVYGKWSTKSVLYSNK